MRAEGYRVVLINSNPATIMTDPDMADATYIEPITPAMVTKVIERERPDAILPTMGGQTALNVAMALHRDGVLEKYGVELIGANAEAISKAEDRLKFRDAMTSIGVYWSSDGLNAPLAMIDSIAALAQVPRCTANGLPESHFIASA